ncbi:MAG: hypothetical protein AAF447_23820 [Myxococcota bacterium]
MTQPSFRPWFGQVGTFHSEFLVRADVATVRRFHGSTRVLRQLTPPVLGMQLHAMGAMEEGMVARFTLWFGPLPVRWTARHEQVSETGFVDVQQEGPMAEWRHTHRFEAVDAAQTRVIDHIEYAHPPLPRALLTYALFNGAGLRALFAYRALVTQRACARMAAEPPPESAPPVRDAA